VHVVVGTLSEVRLIHHVFLAVVIAGQELSPTYS
jgi:hypothetical protein